MKRLSGLAFSISLLLTMICTVVVVSSGTLPESEHRPAVGLMRCGDLPCYQTITPGETSWRSAVAALGGQSIIREDASYSEIALFPSSDGGTVASILLDRPIHPVTIGNLVALYGTPTCMVVFRESNTLMLHYPLLHVYAQFSDKTFTPFSHARSIVLGTPAESTTSVSPCTSAKPETLLEQAPPWQIFGAVSRYLRRF
ncbi:MAG TPA: hypothetical protein VHD90_24165 [Phototrophicaceae bacterium]|nr:hypothetical protein [Phototrophicaceae bacterium]